MSSDDEMELNDSDSDQEYSDDNSLFEEDIATDETHDGNSSNCKKKKSIDKVFDSDSLQTEMKKAITDVQTILQVKPGVCRILLHKYKWNKESLLERFYEHTDTTTFLFEANVIPRDGKLCTPSENGECDICCSVSGLTGLACYHQACTECWRSYLTDKIVTGRQSEIECMASNCKLLIDDEKILFYATDPNVIATYRRLIIDSYVESNKFLKWCPGIDCGKAVKTENCETHIVVCSCGSRFCFSCSNDWHEPLSCRHLKLWLKRCSDDSETYNWINANTKDCPKCLFTIEKNGGCNYMRCQNKSCQHAFCWLCMGPYDHVAHNCNSFEDSAANNSREMSRVNLDRYLFYYNRYMGHMQSLKLEEKLCATVEKKMDQMETMSMSWAEVQYLKKAIDVLSECRRTLMYTYAFAFYLERNNHSIIFDTNQKDLQQATEDLSGFLERDLENENLVTLKQKVQDKCRYVEHRRKVLLDHCVEGTEQDIWEYNE